MSSLSSSLFSPQVLRTDLKLDFCFFFGGGALPSLELVPDEFLSPSGVGFS
jgi:hypothetical protein